MRKFSYGLNRDLILEGKTPLLIKDMDISRLSFHMHQVEDEKKKKAKLGDRQGKRSRSYDQGGSQYQGSWDSGKWYKKK